MILLLTAILMFININVLGYTDNLSNYTAKENKIYKNGNEIKLNGINWFGAEVKDTLAPHGLWQRNYKDMITQIKNLGFNSVRLPFCPLTLKSTKVGGVNYVINPDLNGKSSLEVYDKIIAEFANQQIYILIDHHRPDCEAISELWYTDNYSEEEWILDLLTVTKRYKENEYFMGIDIKNEPHGKSTWSNKNYSTDWNKAAIRASKRIYAQNPKILIFIEGIGDTDYCDADYDKFWGGNFSPIKCTPLDYENIPQNKIVYSPHVYGPDVHNAPYFNNNLKDVMPSIWDSHFGFLIDQKKTIAIGEFGGFYKEFSKDREWQNTIIDYFINKKICNTFYWSFNPNSKDTGGILNDDWLSVNMDKLNNLGRLYKACNSYSVPNFSNPVSFLNQEVTIEFKETSRWFGNNFCGDFVITNNTEKTIENFTLLFDTRMIKLNSWNANFKQISANRWSANPTENWNKKIYPYTNTQFGLCTRTQDGRTFTNIRLKL
jgi:endoglucanase